LSHPFAAAQYVLVSNIESNNSPTRHLNPLLTYVASFNDGLKHHLRATSNAKHPTPERLRTCDGDFNNRAYNQRETGHSPKLNARPTLKTVLDVAVGGGAGYIDMVATAVRSGPRPRRTTGCTADRDLAVLKW
jgi:hypothetical protein